MTHPPPASRYVVKVRQWAAWRAEYVGAVYDPTTGKDVCSCSHQHGRRIGEDGEALARRCGERMLRRHLRREKSNG